MATARLCSFCPIFDINGIKLKLAVGGTKLDDFFGITDFKSKSEPKDVLAINRKIRKDVISLFIPNSTRVESSLSEMTKLILERDYPDLLKFINEKEKFRPIFLPATYIPSNPEVLDPSSKDFLNMVKDIEKSSEGKKKEKGKKKGSLLERFGGLMKAMPRKSMKETAMLLEEQVTEILKEYYQSPPKHENVVVFHGITIPSKFGENTGTKQEVDFLIINHSRMTITTIEVKTTLENKSGPDNSYEKIKKNKAKELLEDWFSSDLSPNWNFQALVFYKKLDMELCIDCKKFAISSKDGLIEMLEKKDLVTDHEEKSYEEFGVLCRYLIFCVSSKTMVTTGNLPLKVQESLEQGSKAENIELWFSLTPGQMVILRQNRIVFLACFGSGKTILMIEKAKMIAETGEKVLFIIIIYTQSDSLLVRDIQEKLNDFKNIKVLPIKDFNQDVLKEIKKEKFEHVVIDEFYEHPAKHMKPKALKEFQDMAKKLVTFWVAISGAKTSSSVAFSKQAVMDISYIQNNLESVFPSSIFNFPRLELCLRQPSMIQSYSKVLARRHQSSSNSILIASAKTPPNIAHGLFQRFKEAMVDTPNKNQQQVFVIDESMTSQIKEWAENFFQGKPKPLFLIDSPDFKNNDKDIMDWIKRKRDFEDRALITTYDYLRGYEHHTIVLLSTRDIGAVSSILTRSMGIIIDASEELEKSGETCDCSLQIHPNYVEPRTMPFLSALVSYHSELGHKKLLLPLHKSVEDNESKKVPKINFIKCQNPFSILVGASSSSNNYIKVINGKETIHVKPTGPENEEQPFIIELNYSCCLPETDLTKKLIKQMAVEWDRNILISNNGANFFIEVLEDGPNGLKDRIAKIPTSLILIVAARLEPRMDEIIELTNDRGTKIKEEWLQNSENSVLVIQENELKLSSEEELKNASTFMRLVTLL